MPVNAWPKLFATARGTATSSSPRDAPSYSSSRPRDSWNTVTATGPVALMVPANVCGASPGASHWS
jgi:hypothetical protein